MGQTLSCLLKSDGFTPDEIKGLAEVHVSEIKSGFLASLGSKALLLLYEHATQSGSSIIVGAFEPGLQRPLGFIWVTSDCGSLYREFLRQRGLRAVRIFLPRLLSLTKLRKAFETLLYPTKTDHSVDTKAEILNFAVSPEYRGSGLAEKLFDQGMSLLKDKNVEKVKIVTGKNQVRAHKFYEKMGAVPLGSLHVHKEEESLIYLYEIK